MLHSKNENPILALGMMTLKRKLKRMRQDKDIQMDSLPLPSDWSICEKKTEK